MDSVAIPRVFISYSWEDEAHKTWVRFLAEQLNGSGINTRLDQWFVNAGESFTQFMEQEVEAADFIIAICTPNFAKKSNSRKGGVGYEQQIVSGKLVSGEPRSKFIPLLRRGDYDGINGAIPTHFIGVSVIDFRDDRRFQSNIEELVRAIYSKPKFGPPPIGSSPNLTTITQTRIKPQLREEKTPSRSSSNLNETGEKKADILSLSISRWGKVNLPKKTAYIVLFLVLSAVGVNFGVRSINWGPTNPQTENNKADLENGPNIDADTADSDVRGNILSSKLVEGAYRKQFFYLNEGDQVRSQRVWDVLKWDIGNNYLEPGWSIALISAVAEYPSLESDPGFHIGAVQKNVEKLRTFLRDEELFDEIIILDENNFNVESLQYFLQDYIPARFSNKTGGRFLFVHSGLAFESNDDVYISTIRTTNSNDRARSINMRHLALLLQEPISKAQSSLIILDTEHSGFSVRLPFIGYGGGSDATSNRNKFGYVLASGAQGEHTYIHPELGEGTVLVEALLKGLDGNADLVSTKGGYGASQGDEVIHFFELFEYIRQTIREVANGNQHPAFKSIFNGPDSGIFFLNQIRSKGKISSLKEHLDDNSPF